MEIFFETIAKLSSSRHEEDTVDRLNFRATPIFLITAAVILCYKAYFGHPIICWTPMEFRSTWDQYVNDFCFIENTYYLPLNNCSIPADWKERHREELPYYQWVPFVLALQAMAFSLPHIFWRMTNWLSGVQVRAVINMALSIGEQIQNRKTDAGLQMLSMHLTKGLKMSRRRSLRKEIFVSPNGFLLRLLTWKAQCYITLCYFAMKLMFLANLVVQLFVLNFFLRIPKGDSLTWGFNLLIRLFSGIDWSDTGMFPRLTLCDFEVRVLGNMHRYTVQCVLPLNMLNEKIFIILWFWIHGLIIAMVINIMKWIVQLLVPAYRMKFLDELRATAKILQRGIPSSELQEQLPRAEYMDQMLGWDGCLILRLMQSNSGQIICSSLIIRMFAPVPAASAPKTPPDVENEEK